MRTTREGEQRKELTVRVGEEMFEALRNIRHERRLSQQELLMQALVSWIETQAPGEFIDPMAPQSEEERGKVRALLAVMRCADLDSIGTGLRDITLNGLALAAKHIEHIAEVKEKE